jgi:hypothetical protein
MAEFGLQIGKAFFTDTKKGHGHVIEDVKEEARDGD